MERIRSINYYNSVIRFVYDVTLDKEINKKQLPMRKQKKEIYKVLTNEELSTFFNVVDNFKYKTIFMLVYGSGLRIGEVVNLGIDDIDSKNMRIYVNKGKGRKERYTILPERSLNMLREYWSKYRQHKKGKKIFLNETYNSCRNRHCPNCQTGKRLKWIEARKEEVLNIKYYHIVFTIPNEIYDIAIQNQNIVYKILFKASAETLQEFKKAKYVIQYLGRYTHRVAISNERIIEVTNERVTFKVTFKWKDYKDNNKIKEMTISIEEFIRRFLLHILPPHFMKIRYYGILGNRNKKKKILKCKILTRTKIYKKKELPTPEILKKILGENGIIEKAKEARTSQTAAQEKEASELAGAGIEGKINALVNGTEPQRISTRVTPGGTVQVYGSSVGNVSIYYYEGVLYIYMEGTWYYTELRESRTIDSRDIEWLENAGLSNVPTDTIMYTFMGSGGAIQINDCWYVITDRLIRLDPVDNFDTRIFDSAVEYQINEGAGGNESGGGNSSNTGS